MKLSPHYGLLWVAALSWTGWAVGAPAPADDLKAFATGGARILESQKGDLNGDGRPDALLVLDPPAPADAKLGEGPAREVVVLVRDASGQLQKVASNARLVPCEQCGGSSGDPFGYSKVAPGSFTIVNGGGGREHWSDEYTFTYSAEKRDWFVTQVARKVEDSVTGRQKAIQLSAKDLGSVSFQAFDPSKLPEVTLP